MQWIVSISMFLCLFMFVKTFNLLQHCIMVAYFGKQTKAKTKNALLRIAWCLPRIFPYSCNAAKHQKQKPSNRFILCHESMTLLWNGPHRALSIINRRNKGKKDSKIKKHVFVLKKFIIAAMPGVMAGPAACCRAHASRVTLADPPVPAGLEPVRVGCNTTNQMR